MFQELGSEDSLWQQSDSNQESAASFGWLILGIDTRGSICRFNDAAYAMLGYPRKELVGAFYSDLILAFDSRPDLHGQTVYGDPILRCLSREEACANVVGVIHCKDRHVCAIEGSVAPAYGQNREISGAIFIAHPARIGVDRFLQEKSPAEIHDEVSYANGSLMGRALVSYIKSQQSDVGLNT